MSVLQSSFIGVHGLPPIPKNLTNALPLPRLGRQMAANGFRLRAGGNTLWTVGLAADVFSGLPAKLLCQGFNQYCPDDSGSVVGKGRLVHGSGKPRLPHPFLPLHLTDLETEPAT